jgi:predicted O-methyltransferase YrrM
MSSTLELVEHIERSLEKADKGESKITDGILNMEGMSGKKTRHFYNNLLNKDDARYLEIGTWKGSSVCSAMCGNKATIVCIDNWSEFGGPKNEFLTNFNTYKGENNAKFIEQDCFKVDVSLLPKFNIYMYDGNHTNDSHYKALVHYYPCLDDIFVFIVDDWAVKDVRDGTYESIKKLNLRTLYEKEIYTSKGMKTFKPRRTMLFGTRKERIAPTYSEPISCPETWWNGMYIAILKKNNIPKYSEIWFDGLGFGVLKKFKNKNNVKFLEIGSFEGCSSNYFVNNFLNGENSNLTCIDPWIKYSESTVTKMGEWDNLINENTYNTFIDNVSGNMDKIIIKRGFSKDILSTLQQEYDFIYVDGDHSEQAVWIDSIFSFNVLKVGGIMVFDDYTWNHRGISPKNAIDRFLQQYSNKIKLIFKHYQVGIEKISN